MQCKPRSDTIENGPWLWPTMYVTHVAALDTQYGSIVTLESKCSGYTVYLTFNVSACKTS